jgi:hypothetical protein
MRHPLRLVGSLAVAVLVLAACSSTSSLDDPSTVFFQLDAPLCSMALPVRLSIDGTVVGVDTFRVNVANPHLTTRGFRATPGRHLLSAFAFNGTWPDTTVTLSPGFALTDTLSFYCS